MQWWFATLDFCKCGSNTKFWCYNTVEPPLQIMAALSCGLYFDHQVINYRFFFFIKYDSGHVEIFFLEELRKTPNKIVGSWSSIRPAPFGKLQCSWSRIFLGPKSWFAPVYVKFQDPHLEIEDFRFKYTQNARFQVWIFKNFLGRGSPSPLPQTPPPA